MLVDVFEIREPLITLGAFVRLLSSVLSPVALEVFVIECLLEERGNKKEENSAMWSCQITENR